MFSGLVIILYLHNPVYLKIGKFLEEVSPSKIDSSRTQFFLKLFVL